MVELSKHNPIDYDSNLVYDEKSECNTNSIKETELEEYGQYNEKGQLHGLGRRYWYVEYEYDYPEIEFYEGQWQNGNKHGFGRQSSSKGFYIGMFENNKMSGQGKIITQSGV